ncbi:MAG: tetratricopeptide repeat protein, partial [Salibacteraceae bacterium]
MLKYFTWGLLLLGFHFSHAQGSNQLDSLLTEIDRSSVDSVKARLYLQAGQDLKNHAPDSALSFYQMSDSIVALGLQSTEEKERNRYLELRGLSLSLQARHFKEFGDFKTAEKLFEEAILIQEKHGKSLDLATTYNAAGRIYERKGDPQQFYTLTHKALKLHRGKRNATGTAISYIALGSYFEQQGGNDSCLFYYEEAIKTLRPANNKEVLSFGLYEFANVLSRMEAYDRAIPMLLEAVKLYEEAGNDLQTAGGYLSLGIFFFRVDKLEKAESYFKKAAILNERIQSIEIGFSISSNSASIHSAKGDYQKSLEEYTKALEIAQKFQFGPNLECILLSNMAQQYKSLGDLELAISSNEKAISLGDQVMIPTQKAILLYDLGRAYFDNQQLNKAILTLERSLRLSKENKQTKLALQNHFLLSQIYDIQTKYQLAHDHLQEAYSLKDTINKANTQSLLVEKEAEFVVQQKEQEIIDLEKVKELQELRLANQNNQLALDQLYIVLLGISVLLIGGIFYWFYSRLRLKKERIELKAKTDKLSLEKENLEAQKRVELAKAKEDLFANVSHEFRTPLTLIQVPVKQMLQSETTPEKSTYQSILNNTDQLLQMVDEILELSRIEDGQVKLSPAPLPLDPLMAQLQADFTPLFQEKSIGFRVESDLPHRQVEADHNRLKMVLNNLLKNAWHHCPTSGEVVLSLRKEESETVTGIRFEVSNTHKSGMIPDPELLFERYHRKDEAHYKGHGLGLAISKQLVELHGGTLAVDTDTLEVIRFVAQLPLEAQLVVVPSINPAGEIAGADFQQVTNAGHLSRAKILVVEDHVEMQALLRSLLEPEFEVVLAENGQEGEKMAIKTQPNLVLSDVMMPQKNGFELLQSLRQNAATSHLPVVLLTARADKESRISGLEFEADDYISKPFDHEEVLVRIRNLVRQRQRLHELFKHNPFQGIQSNWCSTIDQQFMERARQVLEANFHNGEFTVEHFCSELAMTRSNVHNKLKALTDQSASQFIQNIRLTKAAEQLLATQDSIDQVYTDCGFNSRQAFYKAFRKKF